MIYNLIILGPGRDVDHAVGQELVEDVERAHRLSIYIYIYIYIYIHTHIDICMRRRTRTSPE